jgi:uncharacterized membrane protein YeaQ/YmgE (transglycosylase-associated protein family)
MNTQQPRMLMPALIGGLLSGVLTAIPFVSCFCCLWVIAGGLLASYLLSKDSPRNLTTGDGVIVGIFAGIIGAVVDTIVSIPFDALLRNSEFMRAILDRLGEYAQDLPAGLEGILESGPFNGSVSVTWMLLGLVLSMVIFSVFSALGGIIGVSLFKKKPNLIKQANNENDVP